MPTFDTVIVGGGTAGCVLAARLTEDPARHVLLLEAGPDYPTVNDLPPEVRDGWSVADTHDWGYTSEPGPGGQTLPLLRGRLMGGCSSLNATAALRGAPADYDDWANRGNPGWSFDDVLPAFIALEHDLDFGAEPWHGRSGPLPIRRYPEDERTQLSNTALAAMCDIGFPSVDDHNRPGAIGAGALPMNTLDGVRMSTAVAYLALARERANLTIRPGALVDRVAVERSRARGVLLAGGERIDADELVVATGAYATPSLLLRSGIGPANDLRALGIAIAADLVGVGKNLIDHPLLSLDVPIALPSLHEPKFQIGATFRSADAPHDGSPDLQLFLGGPWDAGDGVVLAGLAFSVVKPRSRGRVTLRSTDPDDPPRIEVGHLRDPRDLSLMVQALRAAREVTRTPTFEAITVGDEVAPAPGIADGDDTGLAAAVRTSVSTYHHPVGTCRIGPDPDGGAVVDARGRVHGVDGLRIADASVMPDIPAANTNVPTIMVAERIAALMREPA